MSKSHPSEKNFLLPLGFEEHRVPQHTLRGAACTQPNRQTEQAAPPTAPAPRANKRTGPQQPSAHPSRESSASAGDGGRVCRHGSR